MHSAHPRNLRSQFRPVAQKVDWPGSFHSLRHFVASVALSESGGNEFVTSRVLGHVRRATTTDIYGHLLAEEAANISTALERRISGS